MAYSLLILLHTVLFLEQLNDLIHNQNKKLHLMWSLINLNSVIYLFQTMQRQKILQKMDASHQFFHQHQ